MKTARPLARLVGALALVLGTYACGGSATPSPFGSDGNRGLVEVRVDNITFNDATVFAITLQRRRRLGVVQGKSTGRFNIEWEGLQDLEIAVDLLAGQSFVSQPLQVTANEVINVQVREPISNSVVSRGERRR